MTIAEVASDLGLTVDEFIASLQALPGWPCNFDPNGYGEVACFRGPANAPVENLPDMLKQVMLRDGYDLPPVGIVREADRTLLYIQQPNTWMD